ncbi:MAG: PKD domain-containing protein [Planctomycetes bacterium]|nr:PKD domain-containing protein [Planctomycetota bacterium]
MRLPWFSGSWPSGRPGRGRRQSNPSLRVRQLERRCVLDAAVQSLVVGPTIEAGQESTVTTSVTTAEPLVFDWAASEATSDSAAAVNAFAASAQGGGGGESQGDAGILANTGPVVVAAVDQDINEGQLLDLSGLGGAPPLGLLLDPDLGDTHTATVNWGDGTGDQPATVIGMGPAKAIGATHTYADGDVPYTEYTVTVTVTDSFGAMDSDTFVVRVHNVDPTLTISGDPNVDEGSPYTLNLSSSDPGDDTITSWEINWGDGNIEIVPGNPSSATHTYEDGDANYVITATATDEDGTFAAGNGVMVMVDNVAPTITAVNLSDVMLNEGQSLTVSGTFTDPALGVATETFTVMIDWGNGDTSVAIVDQTLGTYAATYLYADDHPLTATLQDVFSITVTVTDDDGGSTSSASDPGLARSVTIKNVAPTITAVNLSDMMLNEGQSLTVSGTFSDPALGIVTESFTVMIDWGNGDTSMATVDATLGTYTATYLYADDHPLTATLQDTFAITVVVTDDDGGSFSSASDVGLERSVTVKNVAPTITTVNLSDVVLNEGQSLTVSGAFTDPALGVASETFTVMIDWGNGDTSVAIVDQTLGTYTATYLYADDHPLTATLQDTFSITVVVTDDDGGSVSSSSDPGLARSVTIKNVAPTITAVNLSDVMLNEGQSLTISGTFTDPALGVATESFTVVIDWGNGDTSIAIVDQTLGTYTATYLYADDHPLTATPQDTFSITVTVIDDDGGSVSSASDAALARSVTIKNVAPAITAVNLSDVMLNEGQSLTVSGTFTDPALSVATETFTVVIDWGNGDTSSATVNQTLGTYTATYLYADDHPTTATLQDTFSITVTVTDDDTGSVSSASDPALARSVTIKNVAPTIAAVNLSSSMINEGQTLSIDGTFNDPALTVATESFAAYVIWGDGYAEMLTVTVMGGAGLILQSSHTYADDGDYTVRVRLADDDMGAFNDSQKFTSGMLGVDFVEQSAVVTVNNVVPVLDETHSTATINEGQTVSFNATFGDDGFDNELNPNAPVLPSIADPQHESFRYYVNWGDGRETVLTMDVADINGMPGVQSTGDFSGLHTYADDGTYTVRIRLADDNMAAYYDATKFGLDAGGNNIGVAGVDFVEQTFTVVVNNVAPSLTGTQGAMVDEGHAFTLASLGIGLEDPGFDNALNPTTPTLGNPFAETFTSYQIDWGDGRGPTTVSVVDRVSGSPGVTTTAGFDHLAYTYADDGLYTVTIRVADDNMSGDFVGGTNGVDFVDLTFVIQVNNVVPTIESVTPSAVTINESGDVSFGATFSDFGFDNELNPNAPVLPLIADPRHESFAYFIDWGDGRDQVGTMSVADLNGAPGVLSTGSFGGTHNYADDGVYQVTIRIADDNMAAFVSSDMFANGTAGVDFVEQTFLVTVNNLLPAFVPVGGNPINADDINADGITRVRVSFNDFGYDNPLNTNPFMPPAVGDPLAESFTYVVNWGDGTIDTISVINGSVVVNGQTTVLSSMRASGDATTLTTGSFEVQHLYFGPPDPLHPTADVIITLTLIDDNGGSISATVAVGNPGIDTVNVAIDTTPQVPRLEFVPPAPIQVLLDQSSGTIQSLQSTDIGAAGGETAATSERFLELVAYSPDGKEIGRYRLKEEALADLRGLFATLPDGRYKIFLVRTDNNSRRLVIEVYVRRGRVIDPSDDSEGTRDRPPTSESNEQIEAVPLEENPFFVPPPEAGVPDAALQPNGWPVGELPADGLILPPTEETKTITASSLRWGASLAGLAIAANGSRWSRKVDAALERADRSAWQRLRRAGRLGRVGSRTYRPNAAVAADRD